ncbi:MAG TPA: glycosyltransferase family 2 protein [Myxococcales bacterium]|nr:glycosyltransferase family 2 protein [Myxococcales bacterium]
MRTITSQEQATGQPEEFRNSPPATMLPGAQSACYPTRPMQPELSVVIPLYNEEANVEPLLAELLGVLRGLARTFEVICVDDGSRDGTFARLAQVAQREPALRVIRFRLNFGQTAAMSAGIEAARGAVIVPMDGDLQNDPADIARLLARLDEGYDVVSGWRRDRKDKEFGRKLPSRIANRLISAISGVRLHDYGCSLKAYRRDVLRDVKLYGEMHRFIPIYASWQGARVTEMVVNHRARKAGRSKYGLDRTLKVLLDLFVVKFLASYATRPIHVFGGFGLFSWLCAAIAAGWAVYYKVRGLKDFVQTPLPLLAVMFTLVGALSLLMGLLAELVVRTYYESQGKRPYLIAEELNAREDSRDQPLRAAR